MNVRFATPVKPKPAFGSLAVFIALACSAAAAPPAIRVLQGANQLTSYGAAFPDALVVWVTDPASQRAIPGAKVNFTPGSGIGLSASSAVTNEYGLAYVTANGLLPCVSTVTAEVEGYPGVKAVFDGLGVQKATLTVVPGDINTTAGKGIPAATTYTIQGFVNGETLETAQVTGSPVLTTTANDHSPHANYAIKGGVGTLSAPNYNFVAGFGTLAILDDPKSGSSSDQTQEASLEVPAAREDGKEVRPAILKQITESANEPTFVAGIHEQDGVSVQGAISPQLPIASTTAPSTYAGAAIRSEPLAGAVKLPAFVAGLQGQSGVFVRAAIWPGPAAVPASTAAVTAGPAMQNVSLTSATVLPTFVAGVRNSSGAAVRTAIEAQSAPDSAFSNTSSTRSALPAVVAATLLKVSDASVRAAISPDFAATSGAPSSSYVQPGIRKALNPPGTE